MPLVTDEMDTAQPPREDPGYQLWQSSHPEAAIVCWSQGDLNNDGQSETVLIYALPGGLVSRELEAKEVDGKAQLDEKRWMTVIVPQGSGYRFTEPERAPVGNQKIEFRDIDEKAPAELIISGSKGTEVGYAVYRLNETGLENLFGEGMDKCCHAGIRSMDCV